MEFVGGREDRAGLGDCSMPRGHDTARLDLRGDWRGSDGRGVWVVVSCVQYNLQDGGLGPEPMKPTGQPFSRRST